MTDHQPSESSRELIEQAVSGSPIAVDALLERNMAALRAFVRLRMGPELRAKESCSDLVQSACREVLQNLDRFRYAGENNFRQWLFATALRKVINRYEYYKAAKRDVAREVEGAEQEPASLDQLAHSYQTVSTPSRRMMHKEEIARLESAFDRLPDHYREVITLSRIVGLSHREVAESMGKTESSTRSMLHRALIELSDILEGDSSDPDD